jgi:hypothetical protein
MSAIRVQRPIRSDQGGRKKGRGKRSEEGQKWDEDSRVGEITRTRKEMKAIEPGCKRARQPRKPAIRQWVRESRQKIQDDASSVAWELRAQAVESNQTLSAEMLRGKNVKLAG